jgi:hypothetical protein
MLAGIAILFNTIIPVYLSREIWLPIDLISSCILFYIGNKHRKDFYVSKA